MDSDKKQVVAANKNEQNKLFAETKNNEAAFQAAIDEIAGIATRLLRSLETTAPPKNREEEAMKAKARAAERFGLEGSRN